MQGFSKSHCCATARKELHPTRLRTCTRPVRCWLRADRSCFRPLRSCLERPIFSMVTICEREGKQPGSWFTVSLKDLRIREPFYSWIFLPRDMRTIFQSPSLENNLQWDQLPSRSVLLLELLTPLLLTGHLPLLLLAQKSTPL